MRVFSRIGMVSVVAFAGMGPIANAQSDRPTHPAITSATGKQFRIADAAGRTVALHFVGEAETATPFVRDYQRQAPTLAGVVHIFIPSGEPAAIKAWADRFGESADTIYTDHERALAADLHVDPTPTTIVIGADGKELLRHAAASQDDRLTFAAFAKLVADKTRLPALADYNLPRGKIVAVDGYDVVAYFTQNKAVRGQPALTSAYLGVTYQFSSDVNRRLFAANPEKYLPTYGGWCASAMGAKGTKVEIDPTNFKVKDGRLFLFYKSLLADALKDWNKHEAEWEPAADKNWKKLTREDPIKPAR